MAISDIQVAIDNCIIALKLENVDTYLDFNDLLARDDIDWVLIGSKNYLHAGHCIKAFEAGKHVFCEKPLATTIEDCNKIHESHKKSGKLFETGFVLRHAPLYSTIHKMVNIDKKLGKIISVEANETLYPGHGGYIMRNWRKDIKESGPHILEKCCHDIDILSWIIGSVPSYVSAFGGTDIYIPENAPEDEKVRDLYKTWSQAYDDVDPFESEKTIEDNLVTIMQFRNGVRCSFHTNSNTAWSERRIFICGTKGTIEADLVQNTIKWQVIGESKQEIILKTTGLHGGGDIRIIEDLVKCMIENSLPKTSAEQGFISAIICLSIDEARRKNQVVDLEPIWNQFNIELPK